VTGKYHGGLALMPYIQILISDSIVVWRAFVLLQQQQSKWLAILALLVLLGSFGKPMCFCPSTASHISILGSKL
jgi:hypothetical protein